MQLNFSLQTAIAILGSTGSGKTYAAKVIVETILRKGQRVCIIDPTGAWWGLRSLADGTEGFPVVIFGGDHADVSLEHGAGEQLAALVSDAVVPASIIDTSDLSGAQTTRLLTDFFEELYRTNRLPLHLVMDEADAMAPQFPLPDQRRLQGAVNKIVRRGRIKGFRPIMITQRPAVIDKSVLSQIATMIAMRVTSPQDRKAIETWVASNADEGVARGVLDTLPTLKPGEGWIWSPAEKILERTTFPLIATYDSSRAPEHGDDLPLGVALAAVDVDAIRRSMAAASPQVEEAKIRRSTKGPALATSREAANQPVAPDKGALAEAEQRGFARGLKEGDERGYVRGIAVGLSRARSAIDALRVPADGEENVPPEPGEPSTSRAWSEPAKLNSASVKMLQVLDTNPPAKLTWTQIATLAGLRARGGHFNIGRKALLDAELVLVDGDLVQVATPSTGAKPFLVDQESLVDTWSRALPGAAPRILRFLFTARTPIRKDEVGAQIGMAPRGGHWNIGWKALRDNGIVVEEGGAVSLTSLFATGIAKPENKASRRRGQK